MFKVTQSECAVNAKKVNGRDHFSINMKAFQQGRDNALKTGAEAPEDEDEDEDEELQQLREAINI